MSKVAVGLIVTAVLLLTGRERLHTMARQLELPEIVTAGKFLSPRADYEVWAKAGDHASSATEGSGVTIGIRYRISERALGGRSGERRRSGSGLRRIVGSAPV